MMALNIPPHPHATSHYDYVASKELGKDDPPFYAIIMAAMRKADTANSAKLQRAWPQVWQELQARYWAPGGYLPGEEPPPEE